MYHENTHGLKSASIIYAAYSVSGPSLRPIQMEEQELNNYIHTKNPR